MTVRWDERGFQLIAGQIALRWYLFSNDHSKDMLIYLHEPGSHVAFEEWFEGRALMQLSILPERCT